MPKEHGGEPQSPQGQQHPRRRMGFLQVVGSVLAAGLGVQSSKKRERDFREGRAPVFIAAGLLFTALFVLALYAVVTLVLAAR